MGSRVVFVGNIPYDMTETQITEIFSEVGPVASFRLVFDRDSGKPKGYGFCTFLDPETAASAVRNLNNRAAGSRVLKVALADAEESDAFPVTNTATMNTSMNTTLQNFNPNQLAEILAHLKVLLSLSPDSCRTLLIQNPSLSLAIFHALLAMNTIDQLTMQRILSQQQQHPSHISSLLHEQQKLLLLQVLNLTPDQISALPPDHQQHVLALRAQVSTLPPQQL